MNQPAELLPQFSTIEYVVQVSPAGAVRDAGQSQVLTMSCVFPAWSSDAFGLPVCGGHLYGG